MVSTHVKFVNTNTAFQESIIDAGRKIGFAIPDFRETFESVICENEAIITEFAAILISEINHTVVNNGQTLVSLAGKSGESILALDAKTHAVILNTIGNSPGDTTTPISGLSIAVRALGADISPGNVKVTIVNFLEASVLNKNVTVSATLANSCAGIWAVGETSGDVRDKSAG